MDTTQKRKPGRPYTGGKKFIPINVLAPIDLIEGLTVIAGRQGINRSKLIRDAVIKVYGTELLEHAQAG